MCDEDLEFNPFYKALKSVYKKKHEIAQNKSWLICVPQSNSIKHIRNFSPKFVDLHLLKPSPYFHSQFMSTDVNESRSYEIEDGCITSVDESESCRSTVKILSEELGYSETLKQYRILVLEKPIDQTFHAVQDEHFSDYAHHRFTLEECSDFLYSYDEHRSILSSLTTKLNQFSTNYLVLPDYLYDAACKLKDLIEWASIELFLSHKPRLRSDEKLAQEISYSLENFVIGNVHYKLYEVIAKKFKDSNKQLLSKLQSIQGIDAADLHIQQSLSCPLPKTIKLVKSLENCHLPCAKLKSLHDSLESIAEEIKTFQKNENAILIHHKVAKLQHITSDDLIPIVVHVLIEARPNNLECDLYYIENFEWNFSNKDRLSYCLVTFQAALQFIKQTQLTKRSTNVGECVPESKTGKKENNVQDAEGANMFGMSKMDRELMQLTKMLQESTKELNDVSHLGVSSVIKPQHSPSSSSSKHSSRSYLS